MSEPISQLAFSDVTLTELLAAQTIGVRLSIKTAVHNYTRGASI